MPKADLDAMIEHEKRQVALEIQGEAWAGGICDGIDAHIMAEAAIATAMGELVDALGEAAALDFVADLKDRVEAGAFTPHTVQ